MSTTGSTRSLVLHSYKTLRRTIDQVFQGDTDTIRAAKIQVRQEFVKNAFEPDSAKIQELLKVAEEVDGRWLMLRRDVVQAVRNEEGRYELQLKPQHLQDNASVAHPTERPK
ncbi:LYR motif-containing protein, putative [Ixodes scapularis]|uniref:Complex III assembly factor LYRM7 n=1 Tax=Ixodes scapularis TaxID=6945 RepID=B7Q5V1_IXOSC|nr:LYR motif-containing protein, putative [Ixodes scapularis]|eukprot:XP_002402260.1 LYR motif-containing protein, putative [Ixodes scapularis]